MKKMMTLVMSAALAFFASASLFAADKPKASIEIDYQNVPLGCKVTVSGTKQISQDKTETNYTGKVTLKATAAKGFVFADWGDTGCYLNEDDRSATATITIDADKEGSTCSFTPTFILVNGGVDADYINYDSRDGLGFLDPEVHVFTADLPPLFVGENIPLAYLDIPSRSFPTVSFKGLPAGVKFDAKKLCFTGKPTKAGIYEVSMSVKNASGFTAEQFGVVTVDYPAGSCVNFSSSLPAFVATDPFATSYPVVGEPVAIPNFIDDSSGSGFKSVKVTGLPAGLKYQVAGNTLSGTFTKAGDYAIVATVKFLDATLPDETISLLVRVLPKGFEGEFSECSFMVGDMVGEEADHPFRTYDPSVKFTASGLPSGLKLVKYSHINAEGVPVNDFAIEGTPTKAGYFDVKFTKTEGGVKSESSYVFYVQPAPSFHLNVWSTDATVGTVTGAGVYRYNSKITIKATPKSDYSFKYWEEIYDGSLEFYSDASLSHDAAWFVCTDDSVLDWTFSDMTANFIDKTEDYCELDVKDEGYLGAESAMFEVPQDPDNFVCNLHGGGLDHGGVLDCWQLIAISGSKATITAKGLPAGITLYDEDEMWFDENDGRVCQGWHLDYEWSKMKPGLYDVQLTAKNKSGRHQQTTMLTIYIPEQSFGWIAESDPECTEFELDAGVKYEVSDETLVGYLSSNVKVTAQGLPAGLKLTVKDGAYYFTGTPTQGGDFPVFLTAKWYNFTAEYESVVMVHVDIPTVSVEWDTSMGTVTGAGANPGEPKEIAVGKKVTLTAKPLNKNYVFAGWRVDGHCSTLENSRDALEATGVDYRNTKITFTVPENLRGKMKIRLAAVFEPILTEDEKIDFKVSLPYEFGKGLGHQKAYEYQTEVMSNTSSIAEYVKSGILDGGNLGKLKAEGAKTFDDATNVIRTLATNDFAFWTEVEYLKSVWDTLAVDEDGYRQFVAEVVTNIERTAAFDNPRCVAITNGAVYTVAQGVAFDFELKPQAITLPTVKAVKLPAGLKLDTKLFTVSGIPTKVGKQDVELKMTTAQNKTGTTLKFTLDVVAMPAWAIGTFEGVADDGHSPFTLTVKADGTVSGTFTDWSTPGAKGKKISFSKKGLDSATLVNKRHIPGAYKSIVKSDETVTDLLELRAFGEKANWISKKFLACDDVKSEWAAKYQALKQKLDDAKAAMYAKYEEIVLGTDQHFNDPTRQDELKEVEEGIRLHGYWSDLVFVPNDTKCSEFYNSYVVPYRGARIAVDDFLAYCYDGDPSRNEVRIRCRDLAEVDAMECHLAMQDVLKKLDTKYWLDESCFETVDAFAESYKVTVDIAGFGPVTVEISELNYQKAREDNEHRLMIGAINAGNDAYTNSYASVYELLCTNTWMTAYTYAFDEYFEGYGDGGMNMTDAQYDQFVSLAIQGANTTLAESALDIAYAREMICSNLAVKAAKAYRYTNTLEDPVFGVQGTVEGWKTGDTVGVVTLLRNHDEIGFGNQNLTVLKGYQSFFKKNLNLVKNFMSLYAEGLIDVEWQDFKFQSLTDKGVATFKGTPDPWLEGYVKKATSTLTGSCLIHDIVTEEWVEEFGGIAGTYFDVNTIGSTKAFGTARTFVFDHFWFAIGKGEGSTLVKVQDEDWADVNPLKPDPFPLWIDDGIPPM